MNIEAFLIGLGFLLIGFLWGFMVYLAIDGRIWEKARP